jgi:hypothetical protein
MMIRTDTPADPAGQAEEAPVDAVTRRLASLLLDMVRTAAANGQEPRRIAGGFTVGAAIRQLETEIDTLEGALVRLARAGLVTPAEDGGLDLPNIGGLQRLVEQAAGATAPDRAIAAA